MECRAQLGIVKEKVGEMEAADILNNFNHTEAQRKLFKNIRHMEGKLKSGNTSKVTITEKNGETKGYTDNTTIEQVITDEKEAKYHQTEGGRTNI